MAGMLASDAEQAKLNSKKLPPSCSTGESYHLDGKVFPKKSISCNRGSKKNKKRKELNCHFPEKRAETPEDP